MELQLYFHLRNNLGYTPKLNCLFLGGFTPLKTEFIMNCVLIIFNLVGWFLIRQSFRTNKWQRVKKEHQEVRIYNQLFSCYILYTKKKKINCQRRNSGWMSFNVERSLKLCLMLEIDRKTIYLDLTIIWKLPKKVMYKSR